MAGLEIQIGADSSDLQKKIKEAELALKELSQVKLERIKLGLDTKEINGNIASVKKSLNELKTVSKDTGSAIGGMAPKVANGGNALMQFSRIAQDAPYGIMGIGNNITATTLKNEIERTIANYEPRATVKAINVTADFDNNGFKVYLEFFIVNQTNPIIINFLLERIR